METRLAIQNIVNSDHVHEKDIVMIRNLLNKNSWNNMQENYARTIARKYGYKIERKKEIQKELPKRRAVLRDDRIFIFGEFSREEERIIWDIPGFEYSQFRIPCNNYSIKILRELNCHLSQNLLEWEEESNRKVEGEIIAPEGFQLFPYQAEGVKRIEELRGRVLLADQMGLGKSCQAATYIANHPELFPVLIVCPSGLKLNWQKELRMWGVKLPIYIINNGKDTLKKDGITIMSYNMVNKYYAEAEDLNYKLLVCDESHALIHNTSLRTKSVKYLSKGIDKIILISGTPLTSRPANLYTQLNMIAPEMFNNHQKFLDRYCNAQKDPSGKGCSNSEELHDILSNTIMIRRLKEDVLKDLPPKMYSVIPIEMDRMYREEYELAKKDIVQYIKENYGTAAARRASFGEVMVRMEHLKQIAVKSKLPDSLEYIENIVESGEKVVVFGTHKFVIDMVMEKFGKIALKIDGSLSTKQKQKNVDLFQNNPDYKIMICNVQAGGVGITLTASSNVVFLEYPWTPGELTQAIDRCHRIGTTAECINVHYMIANNTIDEDICSILDKKTKVLADILDGGDLDENVLFNELIEKFRRL